LTQRLLQQVVLVLDYIIQQIQVLLGYKRRNYKNKKCGTIMRQIEDKQVIPACASDKFEKITDIFEFRK